jgi:hypothetical protein
LRQDRAVAIIPPLCSPKRVVKFRGDSGTSPTKQPAIRVP